MTVDRMLKKIVQKKKPLGVLLSTEIFIGGIPNEASQGHFRRRNYNPIRSLRQNKTNRSTKVQNWSEQRIRFCHLRIV